MSYLSERGEKHRIKIYSSDDLQVGIRPKETHLGERVQTLDAFGKSDLEEGLVSAYESDVRYVLVGVPEGIGPRANCGRGGAEGAWDAFLSKILNMQSNRFLKGDEVLVLGHIELDDLMKKAQSLDNEKEQDLKTLRELCSEIDNRVYPVINDIVSAGLKPIVIGGGHNNAYPIIKATSDALADKGKLSKKGIGSINCDPHLDFRALENRHSGNPFSYAFDEGHLAAYFAVAIHEGYNSEEMLVRIDNLNKESERIRYATFEDITGGKTTFAKAVDEGLLFLQKYGLPVGLELDLDSIKGMPVSAETPSGITVEEARYYVQTVSKKTDVSYVHLCEGAPVHNSDGKTIVGKTLAYLVADFIKADRTRE